MTAASVAKRLGRLADARDGQGLEAACRRLAARLELDPSELRAEAERVATRCQDAGATSTDACVELVADELGMPPDALRAEINRLQEVPDAAE